MRSDLASEQTQRRIRVATLALAIAFYAICLKLAWNIYGPLLGFVVCTPVLAVYAAWLLVHRAETWFFLPKWMALRKIHGRRHFFDDHPFQIELRNGQCRIAAAEIFAVLGIEPGAQLHRRIQLTLGEEGYFREADGTWWFEDGALLHWLEGRAAQPDRRVQRLQWWLEHEALPALHRKRERGWAGSGSG